MKILAWDPGETTGWAELNEKAELKNCGNAKGMIGVMGVFELYEGENKPDHVVIEEYRVFPGKAMMLTGKNNQTSQIEGMITAWCLKNKIKFTKYSSSLVEIQQKHSQVKPTGSHSNTHYVYAYNHGWWWLYKNKYVVSKLQAKKGAVPKRG